MSHDDELFADALALPAAKRALFLDRACGGDAALRARVEALLSSHDAAARFLESPVTGRAAFMPEEKPGDMIGRYKLLEKIGEGGCGVVWMAEQAEPVRRRAALKVIKLGMDTKEVVARFEAERQALAMMDHPNVAKVFDAGTSPTGRPYFVMELVRGIPITRYCDERNLPTVQRLSLFIQACHAIQHAHQKGIIHRDIKPSNILVAQHDDVAVPKVIDFGIAKATQGRLTDATVFTAFAQFIGTPAYMSPEQAEFSGLDIDTRTDIYSLGVLLYELLTGRPPFDPKSLQQAGLDEIRRIIREVEPAPPSTRLGTLSDPDRTTVATHRGTAPAQLSTLLRGDLDWIVMKALEKNRMRRYETANGLAADLKRHLNNEPVTARPPSAAYRFQKLVRRNRLVFVAAGVVAVTLIGGLSFSAWSFLRERTARESESGQRRAAVEAQTKAELAEKAEKHERLRADTEKITAQRHLYAANMNLARQAWEKSDIDRLVQLLRETAEFPGRGFEWYYWQRQTHLPVQTLRGYLSNSANVWAVAWSPDGRRIVTGNGDHNARVWEASTGEEQFTLKGHHGSFQAVAFSPDGRRIVTGSNDWTAKVWEANGGPALFTLKGHSGPITSVAYSPDGQRIVTGSQDNTAKLWDATGGSELLTLEGHGAPIWSVAFTPDGQRIVTGGGIAIGRGTQPATGLELQMVMAKVWEARSGRELFMLKGHTRPIRSLAISPHGQWIVTGSGDSTAKIWSAASGQELRTLKGHSHQIWAVAFSPDSRRIVTGSVDRTAKVWDTASGQELHTLKGHSGYIWAVAFSPDSRRIVTGSMDQTAKVWDASTGSGPLTLKGHAARIGSVAFSPDGERIVTASNDWTARVWEAASGQELLMLKGHGARVGSAAFSPDGHQIVTGSHDKTAKLWEASNGRQLLTLEGHRAPILSVAFSPDGRRIVTASQDLTARLWDVANGHELFSLKGHKSPVWSVAYSPDGRRIVTGSYDETAKVWEATSGRELFTLQGRAPILAVAFSPDSQRIVTGGQDQTARLWDAASGMELLTLKGHTAPIASVVYSPDGQRIVTGSDDKTARVWEATTGQELLTLIGHTGNIESVAFSPDGRQIVTGSDDRVAHVWLAARAEHVSAWQEDERVVAHKVAALQRVRPGLPAFNAAATTAAQYLAALQRESTAEEELPRIARASDEGAIKRWLVLAPIPLAANLSYSQGFIQGLDTEQLEGEARLAPKAGQGAVLASGDMTWQELVQEDYVIDFIAFLGRVTELSVGYAVCYVRSEVRQSGLRLLVGSDSHVKVYLNGNQVHEYRFPRGFDPDHDTVDDITLNAGLNVLVMKVVIDAGSWRFRDSIRFTDAQGNPVKGITVTLDSASSHN